MRPRAKPAIDRQRQGGGPGPAAAVAAPSLRSMRRAGRGWCVAAAASSRLPRAEGAEEEGDGGGLRGVRGCQGTAPPLRRFVGRRGGRAR